MIPRTDQYRFKADRSIDIHGPNTQVDRIQLLHEELNDFMPLVELLPRGDSSEYIVRDPRAGKTGAVRVHWNKVHLAACMVLSSTYVMDDIRETGPGVAIGVGGFRHSDIGISGTAWALINAITPQQLETAIPDEVIKRVRLLHGQVERLAKPQYVGRLKDIQRDIHRWVRDTPGARKWIAKHIVPQLAAMWKEQRLLRRRQEAAEVPVRKRWREARDTGKPFEERLAVIYDRETDPCHMSAVTIGRLRDEGQHDLANLAEAYFVVMLHDAGEAGNLDKLCPLLGPIEGMERPFDWAYLDRMATGLERDDTPPRHSPEAIEGMVARFKARMPVTLAKPDGWTVADIAKQVGRSAQWVRDAREGTELGKPKHGQHGYRYGPDDVEVLAKHLESSGKPTWKTAASQLRVLLGGFV